MVLSKFLPLRRKPQDWARFTPSWDGVKRPWPRWRKPKRPSRHAFFWRNLDGNLWKFSFCILNMTKRLLFWCFVLYFGDGKIRWLKCLKSPRVKMSLSRKRLWALQQQHAMQFCSGAWARGNSHIPFPRFGQVFNPYRKKEITTVFL